MKHFLTFVCVFALAACAAVQGTTPLQRYYGLQADYRATQTTALAYKTACAPQASSHPCHQDVTKIQALSRKVQTTFDTAETARQAGISADFAAAIAVAGAALGQLETLLQQTSEVQ